MEKVVAYYRVSTARQGASGLGLCAQQKAVENLCAARGWTMIAPPFTEVESGKHADRPELLKAIKHCRLTGARLVIAKLDRLSRNAAFLLTLRDSGINFVAADMPDANPLTVGIMSLVAQQEREAISQRTKEALAMAKGMGKRLGNPNGAAALRRAGKGTGAAIEAVRRKADEHADRLRPVVLKLRIQGITSLAGIAKALNDEGIQTPRGRHWHTSSVRNLLSRIALR